LEEKAVPDSRMDNQGNLYREIDAMDGVRTIEKMCVGGKMRILVSLYNREIGLKYKKLQTYTGIGDTTYKDSLKVLKERLNLIDIEKTETKKRKGGKEPRYILTDKGREFMREIERAEHIPDKFKNIYTMVPHDKVVWTPEKK
jgi:hypothetical protein